MGFYRRLLTNVGCNVLSNMSYVIGLLSPVTNKVTHCFYIYNKISELLLQKQMQVTLFSLLLTETSPVPGLSAVCKHDGYCSSRSNSTIIISKHYFR